MKQNLYFYYANSCRRLLKSFGPSCRKADILANLAVAHWVEKKKTCVYLQLLYPPEVYPPMKQIKVAPMRFMRRRQSNLNGEHFLPETPEIFWTLLIFPAASVTLCSVVHRYSTSSGGKRRIELRIASCAAVVASCGSVASCSSLSQRAGDFFPLQMFVEAKLNLALLFEISFKETAVINGQSQLFGRRWQQLMPLWLLKIAHRRAGQS